MGFEELGKKLMRLGQDTKSGVQKMSESYQLNTKLTEEKKRLEQLFRVIGETVYNENKETPLKGLEEEFETVEAIQKNIAEYTEQRNKVKGILYCEECGREASKGEKFCAGCGAKLPETGDNLSEKMKQDAKEAVGEAGEIMGDVVDKARVLVGNVADRADAFVKGVASRINGPGQDKVVLELNEEEVKTRDAQEPAEGSGEDAQHPAEACVETSAEEIVEETAEKADETMSNAAKETPQEDAAQEGEEIPQGETAEENGAAVQEAENAGKAEEE